MPDTLEMPLSGSYYYYDYYYRKCFYLDWVFHDARGPYVNMQCDIPVPSSVIQILHLFLKTVMTSDTSVPRKACATRDSPTGK